MAWPSGNKANTTHLDAGSDKPSLARPEIKKNVDNVNTIIDYFGTNGAYDEVGDWNKQQYFGMATLTAGASISWNLESNQVATVTLDQNSALANPTNQQAGATYVLIVKQPAGNNYTLSFGSDYLFAGGEAPTITASNGSIDVITFISDGTNMLGGFIQDFS
jgi:hypothetical protein